MLAIKAMLFVAAAALVIGICVSIIYFVVGSLYIIPYSMWLGCRISEGQYKYLEKTNLRTSFKCASKLYMHWIFKRELDI